jgi:hypothetical protein
MKKCSKCGLEKNYSEFFKDNRLKSGYRADCKECHLIVQKLYKDNNHDKIEQKRKEYQNIPEVRKRINQRSVNWNKNNLNKTLLSAAKKRAAIQECEFNIDLDDIKIPKFCPLLGIEIIRSDIKVSSNSPSLDKINPDLGYVKNNVHVISRRANTIKNNATIDEIEQILLWFNNKKKCHKFMDKDLNLVKKKTLSLFKAAKKRAIVKNIPFEISKGDIQIPFICPILGIKLELSNKKICDSSPSMDRIDNNKGYTKDNIHIVSYKANRIKNDASYNDINLIYKSLRKIIDERI